MARYFLPKNNLPSKKNEKRRLSKKMLSITECKKKLNKNGVKFNDEEIELIRNVLYKLAEVCYDKIKNQKNDNKKINGIV